MRANGGRQLDKTSYATVRAIFGFCEFLSWEFVGLGGITVIAALATH